jgi:hypothetical protein
MGENCVFDAHAPVQGGDFTPRRVFYDPRAGAVRKELRQGGRGAAAPAWAGAAASPAV